jgi:hypothetical protein
MSSPLSVTLSPPELGALSSLIFSRLFSLPKPTPSPSTPASDAFTPLDFPTVCSLLSLDSSSSFASSPSSSLSFLRSFEFSLLRSIERGFSSDEFHSFFIDQGLTEEQVQAFSAVYMRDLPSARAAISKAQGGKPQLVDVKWRIDTDASQGGSADQTNAVVQLKLTSDCLASNLPALSRASLDHSAVLDKDDSALPIFFQPTYTSEPTLVDFQLSRKAIVNVLEQLNEIEQLIQSRT